MNYFTECTKFGEITIAEERGFITNLKFGRHVFKGNYNNSDILKESFSQLKEYLEGKRTVFNLPLNPQGTKYQQKIWSILLSIPYGETRTYKEIAALSGNEKSSRAVGGANHNNPILIFIPCHRVIGADGKLTGFASGLELKDKLLSLEHASIL